MSANGRASSDPGTFVLGADYADRHRRSDAAHMIRGRAAPSVPVTDLSDDQEGTVKKRRTEFPGT